MTTSGTNIIVILKNYLEGKQILVLGTDRIALFDIVLKNDLLPSTIKLIFMNLNSNNNLDYVKESDIVLVGIDVNNESQPKDMTQLSEIVREIEKIREKTRARIIPWNLPILIVFSISNRAITVKLLREKIGKETPLIRPIFQNLGTSIFREEIYPEMIRALEDKLLQLLGISELYGKKHFDAWLNQFNTDRGFVVRIMENFRFFSAEAIIKLFDSIFKEEAKTCRNKIELFGHKYHEATDIWFSHLGHPNKSGQATLPLVGKTKWLQDLAKAKINLNKRPTEREPRFVGAEEVARELVAAMLLNKRPMCLVFVDDYIGSGGQLHKHASEFINGDLYDASHQVGGQTFGEKVWEEMIKWMAHSEPRKQMLKIHAIYAIGIENKDIKESFALETPVEDAELGTRRISGSIKVKIMEKNIDVVINIHIADYTHPVFEYIKYENEKEYLESMLRKHQAIIRPRQKEHWAQFEPFGWKECGGLTATYANCQGNTLPIVWGDGNNHIPLFPRYFSPWNDGHAKSENIMKEKEDIFLRYKDIDNDDKNKMLAFVLEKRTHDSDEEIEKKTGIIQFKNKKEGIISEMETLLKSQTAKNKLNKELLLDLLISGDKR